jgi:hypothetical protein
MFDIGGGLESLSTQLDFAYTNSDTNHDADNLRASITKIQPLLTEFNSMNTFLASQNWTRKSLSS